MPILNYINFEIPNIYPEIRYDTNCLHFARIFKGNKPFGQWMPNSTHMHAENNCIRMIRTQKKRKNHNFTMVVLRFDSAREHLLMSKPCSRCVDLLNNYRICTVIYSNDKGELIKENTKNIIHKPSSMASKIPKQGRVVSLSDPSRILDL
jgi:deoxycytidylate deaminase